jgi:exoribonuclease R
MSSPTKMQYILSTSDYRYFKLLCPTIGTVEHEFEGAAAANRSLPGDIVTLEECGISPFKRATHPPLAGHLQTRTKTIYGMTSRGVPLYLFTPFNKAYPCMRVGAASMDRTRNYIIIARFDSWEPQDTFPRGVMEICLGDAEDREAEQKAILFDASPQWRSKATLIPAPQPGGRIEINQQNGWKTINIDPAGCRDVDDTISWCAEPDGAVKFAIGIADVASAVEEGTSLDLQARKHAQTIYTPEGKAIRPMLPPELSEGSLSLTPGTPKNTVSLIFTYSPQGIIHSKHFALTNTTNDHTFSYESASTLPQASLFTALTRTIQSSIPAIADLQADDPHNWIQALMVFYNVEAASSAAILRSHSAPNKETLAAMTNVMPELAMYAMEAAKYAHPSTCQQHHGFQSLYCHATSPIRRYADLVNQRALKYTLGGLNEKKPVANGTLLLQLNSAQKAAKRYERDLFFSRELRECPRIVTGIVVTTNQGKIHIYVPKWKRIIKIKSDKPLQPKQQVKVAFVYDASKSSWKDRIICRIESL